MRRIPPPVKLLAGIVFAACAAWNVYTGYSAGASTIGLILLAAIALFILGGLVLDARRGSPQGSSEVAGHGQRRDP